MAKKLTWFISFVVIAFAYLRIYFGVEFTDEAQYVVMALQTSIGAKPFFNEMLFQQTGSLIYEPLVSAYHFFFGSFGIMLFVRHLFFILCLTTAYNLYLLFRRFVSSELAFLTALVPVSFVPHSLPSLCYNTIGSLMFGIGSALTLRFWLDQSKGGARSAQILKAGFSFAICVLAYPVMALGIGLVLLFLSMASLYRNRRINFDLVYVGLSLTFFFALIWGVWIWRFGLDQIIAAFEFSKNYGTLGNFSDKIEIALNIAPQFLPDLFILAGLWLGCFGSLWVAGFKFSSLRRTGVSIAWFVFVVLATFLSLLTTPLIAPPPSHVFFLLLSLSGLPLFLKYRSETSTLTAFVLWLSAILTSMVLCWISSTAIWAMALAGQYSVIALFLLAQASCSRSWVIAALSVLHLSNLTWYALYEYREDDINELTSLMTDGPYAGLFTSSERKQFLTEITEDLQKFRGKNQTVLFYDSFPAGYLLSDLRPMTKSHFMLQVSIGFLARPTFMAFYQEKQNRPDLFFHFESVPEKRGQPHDLVPRGEMARFDPFYFYLPNTNDYKVVQTRTHYKVYEKK
jgi:hypothetical protein